MEINMDKKFVTFNDAQLLGDVAATIDNRQGRDFQGTTPLRSQGQNAPTGGTSRNTLAGENPKPNSFNSRSQVPVCHNSLTQYLLIDIFLSFVFFFKFKFPLFSLCCSVPKIFQMTLFQPPHSTLQPAASPKGKQSISIHSKLYNTLTVLLVSYHKPKKEKEKEVEKKKIK
jgi:hypothetical protein